MIQAARALIMALLIPICVLLGIAAYKKYDLIKGTVLVLPISGYDPVSVLSGHYLTYRIDYGVEGICDSANNIQQGYICFDTKVFSLAPIDHCKVMIQGVCDQHQFLAGVEQFYVPEDKAKYLDTLIRAKRASIVLSVTADGHASVKDLLIDGKMWH